MKISGFSDFIQKVSPHDYQKLFDGKNLFRTGEMETLLSGEKAYYVNDKISLIYEGKIYTNREINSREVAEEYLKAGIDAIHEFDGSYNLVILDLERQELFLIRDRAGTRPLFYSHKGSSFIFSSRLQDFYSYRNFEKIVSPQAVQYFFTYGYIPAPLTIYENVLKLKSGHYLKRNLVSGEAVTHKYFDPQDLYDSPKLEIPEAEAITKTEQLLVESLRLISTQNQAVFLSGGYDSSTVAALLSQVFNKKIKTFTLGFSNKEFNEANDAKRIAGHLNTEHYEHYCTTKDTSGIIQELPEIYDEPFGDSSAIGTVLIHRHSSAFSDSAISSDGGDEIFAGYKKYDQLAAIEKLHKFVPGQLRRLTGSALNTLDLNSLPLKGRKIQSLQRMADVLAAKDHSGILDVLDRHFNHHQLKKFLSYPIQPTQLYGSATSAGLLETALPLDFKNYSTNDGLVKIHGAARRAGITVQSPFINHELLKFVARLPLNYKYNHGIKKYVLKKIAHQYIPEEFLNKPKAGFAVPVYDWLRGDLKHVTVDLINEKELAKHRFINAKEAIRIRDQFLNGKKAFETQVWFMITFQLWWNRHMSTN